MLASLLPGLRDVRTPLTVGYLWLLLLWLWFADEFPTERPDDDGFVARIYDLLDMLGTAAGVAAVSFVAFVLGSLLTIPTQGRVVQRLFQAIPTTSTDVLVTRREYARRVANLIEKAENSLQGLPPDDFDQADWEVARKSALTPSDLRHRLLVANQELYGEYDRLEAECQFRLNLVMPLVALGFTAGFQLWSGWIVIALFAGALLTFQGLDRGARAALLLQRAVLSNDIKHPLSGSAS